MNSGSSITGRVGRAEARWEEGQIYIGLGEDSSELSLRSTCGSGHLSQADPAFPADSLTPTSH